MVQLSGAIFNINNLLTGFILLTKFRLSKFMVSDTFSDNFNCFEKCHLKLC